MADVTILIPSYNHAPFIERTLRSVFAQTLPPKKLIVIDDGSKDESIKIIGKVLADCPFDFEFIKRENRGLCATLNEGLTRTATPYFAYISSDDVWLPRFLESRIEILENRPNAVLSYGYAHLIDEDDRIIDSNQNWGEYADGNALSMLLHPIIPASAAVVYRKNVLERCHWTEGIVLEDYDLYLRLSVLGEFALDNEILSAWRIHDYNTSKDFPLMMNEWLAAIERNAEVIGLDKENLEQVLQKIKFRCVADYNRNGNKKEAWKMFRENLGGAESITEIGKNLARLVIPRKLFLWNRERKDQKAKENNGKLELKD
ncbi:MAG: glycosyltransferase family 2 protein [Pyrinomonadaceae bacterium]|nr:glycosyltransferase family 2 protein [Pyrinomonadaceae bacterium]